MLAHLWLATVNVKQVSYVSGDGNATVNKTVNAMMVNFMYQLD